MVYAQSALMNGKGDGLAMEWADSADGVGVAPRFLCQRSARIITWDVIFHIMVFFILWLEGRRNCTDCGFLLFLQRFSKKIFQFHELGVDPPRLFFAVPPCAPQMASG